METVHRDTKETSQRGEADADDQSGHGSNKTVQLKCGEKNISKCDQQKSLMPKMMPNHIAIFFLWLHRLETPSLVKYLRIAEA